MTEEELKEMMALLEAEGWQPQLCDTRVPRFVGKTSCGIPLEAGGLGRNKTVRALFLCLTLPSETERGDRAPLLPRGRNQ